MKNVFLLVAAAAFSVFAVSCGGGVKKTEVAASDTVERRYMGTIPAADCPGIVYDVTLVNVLPDSTSGGYGLSMTYLEAEDGRDVSFSSTGSWSVVKGIPADPGAVVYRLIEEPMGSGSDVRRDTTDFLFLGDSLVMLGAGMERIASGLNYTLMLEVGSAAGM